MPERWFLFLGSVDYVYDTPRLVFAAWKIELSPTTYQVIPGAVASSPRNAMTVQGCILYSTQDESGVEAFFDQLDRREELSELPAGDRFKLKGRLVAEIPVCQSMYFRPFRPYLLCGYHQEALPDAPLVICWLSKRQRHMEEFCPVAERLLDVVGRALEGTGDSVRVRDSYDFYPL